MYVALQQRQWNLHFNAFGPRHPLNIYKLGCRPEPIEEECAFCGVVDGVFCSLDNMAIAFRTVNFHRCCLRRCRSSIRWRRRRCPLRRVFPDGRTCRRRWRLLALRGACRSTRTCVSSTSSSAALPAMQDEDLFFRKLKRDFLT